MGPSQITGPCLHTFCCSKELYGNVVKPVFYLYSCVLNYLGELFIMHVVFFLCMSCHDMQYLRDRFHLKLDLKVKISETLGVFFQSCAHKVNFRMHL